VLGGADAYVQGAGGWLLDPESVDEHGPEGVELVVADVWGNQDKGGYPGGLADDLVVDVCPEVCGGAGIAGFEREGLRCLGVDPLVAELAVVEVGRVVRVEGAAGEERSMKSDGAGKSWYQSNSPICTCLRESPGCW
jgi:hypothetical protein